MEKVLSAWQAEHDSLRAQCERHGVSFVKVRYWIRKLGLFRRQRKHAAATTAQATHAEAKPAESFLQVHLPAAALPAKSSAQVTLPSGVTLSLPTDALEVLFGTLKAYGLC